MPNFDNLSDSQLDHIRDVCTRYDDSEMEKIYLEWLNELYGAVNICGYTMDSGRVLKNMDEIAFRTSFNDWIDVDYVYIDGDHYSKDDVTEALEKFEDVTL
jgi:hypothetical protein